MRGFSPLIKKSKRLALTAASAALLTFGVTGCDSVDGQGGDGDPDPVPTACGGFGVICDVSGTVGEIGLVPGGGKATAARHYWPVDVTIGPNDEVFVVDWNNHMVHRIDADGIIHRFIGEGQLGDDSSGPATQLNLNHPVEMTIGPNGHYYLSTWHNWKIKKIDKDTYETSAFIGTTQGFVGDGGLKTEAKMDIPSSTVFAPNGNIYVSDEGNQRIRVVYPDGTIDTFAGSGEKGFADGIGTAASFHNPQGPSATPGGKIVLNPDGTALYMADTFNNRIRRIDLATAEVTTIAGTGVAGYGGNGSAATGALLNEPSDIAFSHDNEIYIADSKNNVIRKIDSDGVIWTVAGTGEAGYTAEGAQATKAMLNNPWGLTYDEGNHTLYIADSFNQITRKVYLGHDDD